MTASCRTAPRATADEQQPVFLTTGEDNPNGATVRFLVDGAEAGELAGYARVVYIFDGRDDDARGQARAGMEAREGGRLRGHLLAAERRGRWEKKA